MIDPIPVFLKKVWDKWNIKVIVLVSLFLQTVLILAAPLRKRTSKKLVSLLIWSSYLLADWAANFAIGHISNGQRNSGPCCDMDDNNNLGGGFISSVKFKLFQSSSKRDNDADLVAFWAPFLLLHLGGPDTITAFSLEDNELWLRHLFAFIVQLLATLYVLVLTLPKNNLLVPTILMFVAGIIKYLERTRALFRASLDSFRESMLKDPDPGPNYAKLMEEYTSKIEAGLPTTIEMTPEPDKESKLAATVKTGKLSDFEVVQNAYNYFKIFKGLIVELIFSFRERNESRDFFQCRTAEEALKIIELELNFIYEALYTKVVVVHNIVGYIFRFLSTASVVVAFGLFHFLDKRGLKEIDIVVTYALLGGAICLDAIALFMLIFSDWTFGAIDINNRMGKCVEWIGKIYLRCKTSSWSDNNVEYLSTPKFTRRWSESVSKFNLIDYCLRRRTYEFKHNPFRFCLDKLVDYLGGRDYVNELKYVKREKFPKKLWVLIFDELLEKSREAEDAETTKRICSARGASVFQEIDWEGKKRELYSTISETYIENVTFDESLMLWHVATELCFSKDDPDKDEDYRRFSKVLSDYMLYLLVMQANMMSAVAGIGQIRFRDTCEETKNFFIRRGVKSSNQKFTCAKTIENFFRGHVKENKQKEASKIIFGVNTEVKPVHVKGDRSKSVLFDACMLAKELDKLGDEKWKLISKVWVEMLSYAASHCRPATHAQQVSKGGQLISFVWLLMAHFGLGEQFQINEGHARAKLVVGK
uniref:DUF4220 domain-containing protein n=1 Tax=Fagus sylvatica TaxID=28930 RepID=A0A2N9F0J3_FAGSY